jgi:rhomboid family GlyGly-CTERM serine protease
MSIKKYNMEPIIWALPITILTFILLKSNRLAAIFCFDRGAFEYGEIWRIFTCHFVHGSFEHLFWDLLMFLVLVFPCLKKDKSRLSIAILISMVTIPVLIYIFRPNLIYYVGLSGIDSAIFILFVSLVIKDYFRQKDWKKVLTFASIYILFIIKIYYEMTNVNGVFVNTQAMNMIPVPLAHLIGAVTGAVVAFFPKLKRGIDRK